MLCSFLLARKRSVNLECNDPNDARHGRDLQGELTQTNLEINVHSGERVSPVESSRL